MCEYDTRVVSISPKSLLILEYLLNNLRKGDPEQVLCALCDVPEFGAGSHRAREQLPSASSSRSLVPKLALLLRTCILLVNVECSMRTDSVPGLYVRVSSSNECQK